MTASSLSELPSIDEPPASGSRLTFAWPLARRSSRRQFMRRAVALAISLSVTSIAQLPPARRAFAGHAGSNAEDGWEIADYCPTYATSHNCHYTGGRGCGPSNVRKDACIREIGHPHEDWHKRQLPEWGLRPNGCDGPKWDGWRWRYSDPCGPCRGGITYRCHDGWRWPRDPSRMNETICRALTDCDSYDSRYDGGVSGGESGAPHLFEVRSVDRAGNVDPTPASETWWGAN